MSNHKRDVKLTLADLIAKKADKEAARTRTKDVYVESLGGLITIQAPERSVLYKGMDMIGDNSNAEDTMYANAFLIYNSVKDFREPDLLAAYEVKDPIEIVGKLLELFEIAEVSEEILALTGFSKPEKVKNDTKN